MPLTRYALPFPPSTFEFNGKGPDLRTTAFTDHLKPLILLLMNTGIRRGEAFNLKWSDVDLDGEILTIEGKGAKTSQSRHIPLNEEALQVLKEWRAQSQETGYVFAAADGGRMDNVKSSWTRLLKDAKITNFRLHDLRHHFASMLVMSGEDLNTVRELLGHSDMKMTMRYAHLSPEKKKAAVQRLVNSRRKAVELRIGSNI